MPISISNKTRQRPPAVKFEKIKDEILSESYELSLVFATPALSRRLNKSLRGKDKPTNVLSFPLSENSGEIFLDLRTIKKEREKFAMPMRKLVAYLYIHGCLHLKGMRHGAKMEQTEQKYLNGAANRNWY